MCQVLTRHHYGLRLRIYVKYNVVVLSYYFYNFLRFAHSPNEKIGFHANSPLK
jgi:hypothetical protein